MKTSVIEDNVLTSRIIDVDAFTRKLNEAIEESAVSLTIFKSQGEKRFHVGRSQNGRIEDLTRWAGSNSMLDLEIILLAIGTIYFEMLMETHCRFDAVGFANDFSAKIRDELISKGARTMLRWSEAREAERTAQALRRNEGR